MRVRIPINSRLPRGRRAVSVTACAVALVLVAAACGSSSKSSSTATTASGGSSATTASAAPTLAPVKVALLNDQSGSLASTFGTLLYGVEGAVDYFNAHGGLSGHHIDLSTYDTQSSTSAVLADARLAVQNGAQAIISQDVFESSAIPYLDSVGIPVFGSCIVAECFGKDQNTIFATEGDWIQYETNEAMRYFINEGRAKIAVLSDANPGNAVAAHALSNAVVNLKGDLVYTNYTVDDTSTATLLAVAQRVKSLGAQAVYTNFYGSAPQEMQADLNQIGANADLLTGELGYDPSVPQQFGTSINGLLSETFTATWLNTGVPAIKTYLAGMGQYEPSHVEDTSALSGWAGVIVLGGALAKLGSKPVTYSNLVAAGNSLVNFTGDGMTQPLTFPLMHYTLAPCIGLAQIVNGQWKIIAGTATNPFICGQESAA